MDMESVILQLTPARCKGSFQKDRPYIAEPKLDGHRALLHIGTHLDRAYMTSRVVSKATGRFTENGLNLPQVIHPAQSFAKTWSMKYTVLDGEVTVPGHPFEAVQSVMGSNPERAREWQKSNCEAEFQIFDILFFDDRDVRDMQLKQRHRRLDSLGGQFFQGSISRVAPLMVNSHLDYFAEVISEGGEGLVLKDPESPYGVRWEKCKREATYDVVVMGFTPGKGKFRSMFGAVIFGAFRDGKIQKIGQTSGMPDGDCIYVSDHGNRVPPNDPGCLLIPKEPKQREGTRAWFYENRETLIGSVIEVKCAGLTNHGKLRHPRFVRTRPDKTADMCQLP